MSQKDRIKLSEKNATRKPFFDHLSHAGQQDRRDGLIEVRANGQCFEVDVSLHIDRGLLGSGGLKNAERVKKNVELVEQKKSFSK
jgi:hypothetical protein